MIHTFGDSHSYSGFNKINLNTTKILCHHLGPRLMHSVGKYGLDLLNIGKPDYNVKSGDIVIFCFGEIDCRCHINNYNNYEQVIDNIVSKYIDIINKNNNLINNIKIFIFSVTPAVKKECVEENKTYPYKGTNEERKSYVMYMNKKLKEACNIYNYVFLDVYDKYCDCDGYLNKQLSDNNVHILNPCHIQDFLITHLS